MGEASFSQRYSGRIGWKIGRWQSALQASEPGAASRYFLVRILVVVESPWRRSRDNTQGLSAAARLSPIPAGADLRIL